MCLILFAHRALPGVLLQLDANRDELFARPAKAADEWPDHPGILAGRDLRAGGTWLGIHKTRGRWAAITNFRDPATRRDDAPSRGALVQDYLLGQVSPDNYLASISEHARQYNGFSLLAGDGKEVWFYSNRGNGVSRVLPGVHGLSNHLLDEPWPKVRRGTRCLKELLLRPFSDEEHFALLADDTEAPDEQLPATGIPMERERRSSAIRIRDTVYGTRCSTILRIEESGRAQFHERTFAASGETIGTVSHHFDLFRG